MTDENEGWTAEKEEAWLSMIEKRIGEEAMPDFLRMYGVLQALDTQLTNPPETLGVNEDALRTFLEVSAHQVTNIVMSKPNGEERLITMAILTGMVFGAELMRP